MDAGYNEITEWEPFVGIVASNIHEMMYCGFVMFLFSL